MGNNLSSEMLNMSIPPAIAHAWIKGEYGTGESTGYEFIGWSLLLRGMYFYEVKPEGETELSHWGICTIDIQDGDLTYQGLRIYSKDKGGKDFRFWRSEFSKISRRTGDGKADVYFGYVMDKPQNNEGAETICGGKFSELLDKLSNIKFPPTTKNHSNDLTINDKKEEYKDFIKKSQEYLYNDLMTHLEGSEEQRDDEIIAIIHIKPKENWSEKKREGDYKVVNSPERNDVKNGRIIWTPLTQFLHDLDNT